MPQKAPNDWNTIASAPKNGQEAVRLNRYLAQCGLCSRREADRLIQEGRVTVDGRTAEPGCKVTAVQDVRVDEKSVTPEEERILLAVNKPRGVVCTTDKTWGDRTAEELVGYPKRIFCMGRLDKESEGLLLMTNDGALQEAVMRGAHYHEKEYRVRVDQPLTHEFLQAMASGVYLRELDVTTRPCRVQKTGRYTFSIVLTQGLNRQIRRMCEAFGYRVRALKRVRILNILLGDLPSGAYRAINQEELETLYRILAQSPKTGAKNG